MNKLTFVILGLVAAAGTLASCDSNGDKGAKSSAQAASAAPLTVEESAQITVTANIKAINHTTREVTLQDASGHATSFVAGPQVQRLSEISVGDNVAARYTVVLTAELRPPTAEEKANPISAAVIAGRSSKATDPAGGAAGGVKVVTTVEAVDLANMNVTLKGPMGDTTTFRARNPENVKRLHVGDTIVITYVEAIAVSVVKTPKQ